MKSKSLILLAVSLGFGLVAAIGISQSMGRAPKTIEKKEETQLVLFAKKDIEIREKLTEENCEVKEIKKAYVLDGAVTSFEEVNTKFANNRLRAGMQIPADYVSDATELGTLAIPKGYKLSVVNMKGSDGFANIIKPGNLVDVIGIFGSRNSRDSQPTAKTFLKRIRVFSVNGNTRAVYDEEDGKSGSRRDVAVGLLVTEKQSEKLQLVSDQATIKLTLRGDEKVNEAFDEDEESGTEGMSMDHVYGTAQSRQASDTKGITGFLSNLGKSITSGAENARNAGVGQFKPHSMVIYTNEGPVTYHWDRPNTLPQRMEGFSAPPSSNYNTMPISAPSGNSNLRDSNGQGQSQQEFDAEKFAKELGLENEETPFETGE